MKRTMEDLQGDIKTAMDNIALGIPPTNEQIRTIEDTILDVGEFAGQESPIEVQNELRQDRQWRSVQRRSVTHSHGSINMT